ncbi:MAG: hypothetical protein ABW003_11655 [Microvirga sp.]
MSETETVKVVEAPKPSWKTKTRNAALAAGFYGMPIAFTSVAIYFGSKTSRMNFETAKLNLEAAKLNLNRQS